MKKGNLKNWAINGDEEGLLFFAQRLNELLFDYTLDTYKYYALNISLLLKESLIRISKISEDHTKDENLKSIIEETNLKAQNDLITKEILGNQYGIFFPIELSQNKKQDITKIELLSNRLSLNKIIKTIFKILPAKVESNSKKDIDTLANNLVTSLINVGFHQSYIYYETNNFFFRGKKKENRTLSKFFELFAPDKNEYEVIIKVSDSFQEIQEVCKQKNILFEKSISTTGFSEKQTNYIQEIGSEQVFAICKNIRAYDLQSARLIAINKLNSYAGLFTYFHHKNPPNIDKTAMVCYENKRFITEVTTSPMVKGEDMSHKSAGEFMAAFVHSFKTNNTTSVRFERAINLHSQALSTSSNENRILNLWISFEALFGGGQTTTVIHIINSLSHISSLKYFDRIFSELANSVKTWDKAEFEKIKELTNEKSETKAICSFVVCKEFQTDREELFSKLNDFPLLRFRIFDLNDKLKSPKKIKEYLELHNSRIKWHIKRLYRTRNQVVHDGYSPRNLEILIENAHSYFDLFMDAFIIDNMFYQTTISIEQAITNYELLNQEWNKTLKNMKETEITISNYEMALLYKNYGR